MADVRIVIGTFGDPAWAAMAQRAMASALAQTEACDVVHVHAATLAQARNLGVSAPGAEWIVVLDADDSLDARYVEEMGRAAASGHDIYQPSTIGIVGGRRDESPVLIPPKPLITGNYLVCGSMFRRQALLDVGGYEEWPVAEDWAAFLAMYCAGATISQAPGAIYEVNVRSDSRNNQPRDVQVQTFDAVRLRYEAAYNARVAS